MQPTNRQDKILKAIVEEYINTGQPVGSNHLSRTLNLGVSPATIRSEMALLYELGLLEQPHTSAGRTPSHIGMRRYVDNIMELRPISRTSKNKIDSLFNIKNPDPDKLLTDAAEALSEYTGYATVTSALISREIAIKRLEFIAAGPNTVVIILMASSGVVRNKICRLDFIVNNDIIQFFSKFANANFAGKKIDDIGKSFVNSVAFSLGEYSKFFTELIFAIYELCEEISDGKYYVSGSTKLFAQNSQLALIAKDLLLMIENTENLQKLFGPELMKSNIIIGKENSDVELTDTSVLVTEYYVNSLPSGTVGIIGPVNMDYARVIPHLEYFAKLLGDVLGETLNPGTDNIDL